MRKGVGWRRPTASIVEVAVVGLGDRAYTRRCTVGEACAVDLQKSGVGEILSVEDVEIYSTRGCNECQGYDCVGKREHLGTDEGFKGRRGMLDLLS